MEVVANEVLRKYGVTASTESGRGMPLRADLKPAGSFPLGCARRARTREQGMALVIVGHAIEYLVDSRAGGTAETASPDSEAVRILGEASRAAYQEGKEIVTLRMRLERLLPRITTRREIRWRRHQTGH